MRKTAVCILSLAVLTAAMTGCAKSTKGKVSNEWKVVSYEETYNSTDNTGNVNTTRVNMTETAFTHEHTTTSNGGSANFLSGGSVDMHELEIRKDGTWSWTRDITYVYETSTSKNTQVETGTWSFIGRSKEDDFKKNERILFNVLTNSVATNFVSGQVTNASPPINETYLTGENVRIYTITESKRKELQLEMDSKVVSATNGGGEHTNTQLVKVTLKQK